MGKDTSGIVKDIPEMARTYMKGQGLTIVTGINGALV